MKIDQTITDDEKRLYDYLLKQPNDNGVIYADITKAAAHLSKSTSDVYGFISYLEGKAFINSLLDFTRIDDDFAWITILEKVQYNQETKSPLEYFENIKTIPNDVLEDLIYTLNEGA